jgi:hypothetical protein
VAVEPVQPTFEERPAAGLLRRRGDRDRPRARDLRSGELLFSRAVQGEVDPRDARAVRALVDRALEGQEWARPPAGRRAVEPGPGAGPVSRLPRPLA